MKSKNEQIKSLRDKGTIIESEDGIYKIKSFSFPDLTDNTLFLLGLDLSSGGDLTTYVLEFEGGHYRDSEEGR